MEKKNFTVVESSIPGSGGSVQGMKQYMGMESSIGEFTFSVPLPLSSCRELDFSMALTYSLGNGNGIFGMGFSLNIPFFVRKSTHSIPCYQNSDIILSNEYGELISDNDMKEEGYSCFLPRKEKEFAQIRCYEEESGSYFLVCGKDQSIRYYGKDKNSRIADPENPGNIYSWLLSEIVDSHGNRVRFEYKEAGANRFIEKIYYGNYREESQEKWCFCVDFAYEKIRRDIFRSYRSGFLLETDCLCRKISMIHQMEEEKNVVWEMNFIYDLKDISMLHSIQFQGNRTEKGRVYSEKYPATEFFYTDYQPLEQSYEKMKFGDGFQILPNMEDYHPVDLYGEGLPGILCGEKNGFYYFPPKGRGEYGDPELIKSFPIDRQLENHEYVFMSLEGNGAYDLVVLCPERAGYYAQEEGIFYPFVPFENIPSGLRSRYAELEDMNGDGRTHLIVQSEVGGYYYPSLGRKGFGNISACSLPEDFLQQSEDITKQKDAFVNVFGDGLRHKVRIRNGEILCWPCLGYGRYGNHLELENVPYIKDFDVRRIYFADLDGSGTEDLIYFHEEEAEIFKNLGGRFEMGIRAALPFALTENDIIRFADVDGTGCQSMILTRIFPKTIHFRYDFCKGQKPYLLNKINNHMGEMWEIDYKTTVQQYLEDKEKGMEWQYKPRFPMQVMHKVAYRDAINGVTLNRTFCFREVYYDLKDRVFYSFGESEEWCHGQEEFVEGYHKVCKYFIPGMENRAEFLKQNLEDVSQEGEREAQKALSGMLLQEEMYRWCPESNPEENEELKQVIKRRYVVKENRKPADGCHGSYLVTCREHLEYLCQGSLEVSRIRQEIYWEEDCYGYPLKSAEIWYRREQPKILQQENTKILYKVKNLCHLKEDNYLLGIPVFEEEWEAVCQEGLFSEDAFIAFIEKTEKVLLWKRNYYYWNDMQTECLSLGEAGKKALLHHTREFSFREGVLSELLEGLGLIKEEEAEICQEAGLILEEGKWWKVNQVTRYLGEEGYYLPVEVTSFWEKENPLFSSTCLTYDRFQLLPVKWETYVQGEHRNDYYATPDYQTMKYQKIMDWNRNIKEILYSPLGDVRVMTEYGSSVDGKVGYLPLEQYELPETMDVLSMVQTPEKYVQKAAAFFWQDYCAYERDGSPICRVELIPLTYPEEGKQEKIKVQLAYLDSHFRLVESRVWDGNSFRVSERKRHGFDGQETLHLVSFIDQEGNFYNDDNLEATLSCKYDVFGRKIQCSYPKGKGPDGRYLSVFNKTEYTPWEENFYDGNDTSLESEYDRVWRNHTGPDSISDQGQRMDSGEKTEYGRLLNVRTEKEEAAFILDKAEKFYNTPVRHIYDCMGNPAREILLPDPEEKKGSNGDCREPGSGEEELFTTVIHDIYGRECEVRDARLGKAGNYNLMVKRDRAGMIEYTDSADAGRHLTVNNSYGKVIFQADGEGNRIRYRYDHQQRLTEKWQNEDGLVGKWEYGDLLEKGKEKNLTGRIVSSYGQSGVRQIEQYDLHGNVLKEKRRFGKTYGKRLNWEKEEELENREYIQEYRFSPADQIVFYKMADGTVQETEYNCLGECEQITVKMPEWEEKKVILKKVEYNPEGRIQTLLYGNGIQVKHNWDMLSGEWNEIQTFDKDSNLLMEQKYLYDLAGNISFIFQKKGKEEMPKQVKEYSYDKYYQLKSCKSLQVLPMDLGVEAYEEGFQYDSGGNMISYSRESAAESIRKSYSINPNSNRLADENYVYNDNGCVIQSPQFTSLSWTPEGNLERICMQDDKGNQIVEYYHYDENGSRIRKVREENGIAVWDKRYAGELEEYIFYSDKMQETGRKQMVSVLFQNELIWYVGKEEEGNRIRQEERYCIEDHLQSVILETGEEGNVAGEEEFYSFGETASYEEENSALWEKEYRFSGKEKDEITDLYYFGARYYDGVRFLSADSLEYMDPYRFQGINLFSYCQNNPVNYVDMSGHDIIFIAGATFHKRAEEEKNKLSKDCEMTVYKIESETEFHNIWKSIEKPNTTVVILTHGNKNSLYFDMESKKRVSKIEPNTNITNVILLSCKASRSQTGISKKILENISSAGKVLGANTSVNFMNEKFAAKTNINGNKDGIKLRDNFLIMSNSEIKRIEQENQLWDMLMYMCPEKLKQNKKYQISLRQKKDYPIKIKEEEIRLYQILNKTNSVQKSQNLQTRNRTQGSVTVQTKKKKNTVPSLYERSLKKYRK